MAEICAVFRVLYIGPLNICFGPYLLVVCGMEGIYTIAVWNVQWGSLSMILIVIDNNPLLIKCGLLVVVDFHKVECVIWLGRTDIESISHSIFWSIKSIAYIRRWDPPVLLSVLKKWENEYFNCLFSSKDHLALLYQTAFGTSFLLLGI